MKQKLDLLGFNDNFEPVVETCGGPEKTRAVLRKMKSGETVPMGTEVGEISLLQDGHLEFSPYPDRPMSSGIEVEDRTVSGPAKVNSQAFRDGWDATFN